MLDIIMGVMGLIFVFLIAAVFIVPIMREGSLKRQGKIVRILLYELVGEHKLFKTVLKGYEQEDESLGVYFMLGKTKKVISNPDPKDYFGDFNFGRSLQVCKFAEDDFRVISRLDKDNCLKKVKLPVQDYLETKEIEDEDTGEKKITITKDKKGNPIPLYDDDGLPLPEHTYIPYDEPLGVDQTHREVMRFNRMFSRRMQEKRKKDSNWLEKYMPYIATVAVAFILFISFAYMTNKNAEFLDTQVAKFATSAKEYTAATNNPTFAENLLSSIEKRNTEEAAPPK